jgi:hypothetical protein
MFADRLNCTHPIFETWRRAGRDACDGLLGVDFKERLYVFLGVEKEVLSAKVVGIEG